MAVVLPPEPQYVLVAGFGTHWLLVTCRLRVLHEFGCWGALNYVVINRHEEH